MKYEFEEYKRPEIRQGHLRLGEENEYGESIEVNSSYIVRNHKPYIGVMGEYHFSRGKREEWKKELAKMKAGGVDIVATYLFWIYHEEERGRIDFSGDLDIGEFLKAAEETGMDAVIRIGPWAHGECRNGGFPDWLLELGIPLRCNDPSYMELVESWYRAVFEQVKDYAFSRGGPIIGIQIENELVDQPDHLLELKKLAQRIGFEAPLFTVTGWNSRYGAKIPAEEFLPVFAAYADLPWESGTLRLPPSHNYVFDRNRNDAAVGVDLIKETDDEGWRLPYEDYPFAMCELGPGLQPTHHRRPAITWMDAYAMALCKLGSGNNLMGYYMYHGGRNRIGKHSTFNETKETGYPNDYPIRNYDFQAPLSEYGEARESYGRLNLLHLFLSDFGDRLATMSTVYGCGSAMDETDTEKLRYCARTNGESGFVFVNQYQRNLDIDSVSDVQFRIDGIVFPSLDISGRMSFFMPFRMKLENELLLYATAQPLCRIEKTFFFAEIPGIQAEYAFDGRDKMIAEAGRESTPVKVGSIVVKTLKMEEAVLLRKLSDRAYLGDDCNLYELDGEIKAIEDGLFKYYVWEDGVFTEKEIGNETRKAAIRLSGIEPAFPIPEEYAGELRLEGERKITWQKIEVSSPYGFVEITDPCDVQQIYVGGELFADRFYYGVPWRIPAVCLYDKTAYLVESEIRDDFYMDK